MSPTFREGQKLVISTRAFRHRTPGRFEAVLAVTESSEKRQDLKRIVGLPGETVQLRSGELVVNGELVEEPHTATSAASTFGNQTWKLGPSEYIVLGDNRRASTDSREYGAITIDQIVGPVLRSYSS